MSAACGRTNVEAIAAAATRRGGAGEDAVLLRVLVEMVAPAHVLEIGSSDGACAALVRAAMGEPLRRFVGIDPRAESWRRATARTAGTPGIEHYHASLLAEPGVPHLTRVPALVRALCAGAFDVVVVEPPTSAAALYLTLAQALPLLPPGGVLHCGPLDRCPDALDVVRRLADEGMGPAVLWQPAPDAPPTVLVRDRLPRHNHEETATLRAELLADDPALAALHAAGEHAAVCAHLRGWLARRLVWSTRDLLLPLGALPPPLSVIDVVAECARGEGGVWGYGAAVALAMLYRAFGYPATVYQHGVPDLYWHMMTLVRVPDGRILLEDAFFDAEPYLDGARVPWAEALAIARAGLAGRLEFVSGLTAPRAHVYSRASLATAAADGYLSPGEQAQLAAAMSGCRRVRGEPRALLAQTTTTSLEAFARVRGNAGALAEVRRRTGIAHPLGLLALPCGRLPLSGDPDLDREIVAVLAGATSVAEPAPMAAGT